MTYLIPSTAAVDYRGRILNPRYLFSSNFFFERVYGPSLHLRKLSSVMKTFSNSAEAGERPVLTDTSLKRQLIEAMFEGMVVTIRDCLGSF